VARQGPPPPLPPLWVMGRLKKMVFVVEVGSGIMQAVTKERRRWSEQGRGAGKEHDRRAWRAKAGKDRRA
jgi:hypothetical protein